MKGLRRKRIRRMTEDNHSEKDDEARKRERERTTINETMWYKEWRKKKSESEG